MKKVLVIEDDLQVQDNIHDILSLEECCTLTASDGLEGLYLAKAEHPDLIICDIMLPKLNGYEVLRALRESAQTESIPFIFLTAKAGRSDLRQGMDLGADDYLTKPFTSAELRQAIAIRFTKQDSLEQQTQRKLDDLRTTLAHSLPHELNTPLVGIINGAQVLRHCYDSLDRPEAIEILDCIEKSGKRLYGLVQKFLTYADLELLAANLDQVAVLRSQPVKCFTAYCIQAVAMQKAEQLHRESDLQIELQDAVLPIAEARFKLMVEEIIDNAFKFSPPGSPVRVISRLNQDAFHLFVVDHGRGMTSDEIAAVGAYMQFQRKLYEQQGPGLGVAIARRTVELYGGELTIESFAEKQTIVRITLPTSQSTRLFPV